MSGILGVVLLIIVVPYLARTASQARGGAWAGPRTPAMRSRAGSGRTASRRRPGLSLALEAWAKGRADTSRILHKARAANWLEEQRQARKSAAAAAAWPPVPVSRAGRPAPGAAPPGTIPRARAAGIPAPAHPASSSRGMTMTNPAGDVLPEVSYGPGGRPRYDGGTPVAAGTSTASAEKLIEGINEIHAHAASGGINAKREAVKAVHESFVRFGAMLAMLSRQMSEPGQNYGHEITEPLAQAGTHAQAGAMSASESDAALSTLINMTVGDLATSPRRAPHHEELSESGAR